MCLPPSWGSPAWKERWDCWAPTFANCGRFCFFAFSSLLFGGAIAFVRQFGLRYPIDGWPNRCIFSVQIDCISRSTYTTGWGLENFCLFFSLGIYWLDVCFVRVCVSTGLTTIDSLYSLSHWWWRLKRKQMLFPLRLYLYLQMKIDAARKRREIDSNTRLSKRWSDDLFYYFLEDSRSGVKWWVRGRPQT